jgi:hypothetical protein
MFTAKQIIDDIGLRLAILYYNSMLFSISQNDKQSMFMSNLFLSFVQEYNSLLIIDEILSHPDFKRIKQIAVHCDIDIEMGLLEIRQIIVLRIKSKKHE